MNETDPFHMCLRSGITPLVSQNSLVMWFFETLFKPLCYALTDEVLACKKTPPFGCVVSFPESKDHKANEGSENLHATRSMRLDMGVDYCAGTLFHLSHSHLVSVR